MVVILTLLTTFIFICINASQTHQPFQPAPTNQFKEHNYVRIAAFADVNSDKTTDLLMVSIADQALQVFYGGDEKTGTPILQLLSVNRTANLQTVVPGDFNGDLATDFLLVYEQPQDDLYSIELCIGSPSTLVHYNCQNAVNESIGEPFILDYNGNMRPDILFISSDETFILLEYEPDGRNFSEKVITDLSETKLLPSHSSAFVDLNQDLSADVALTTEKGIAIFLNKDGMINWQMDCTVEWMKNAEKESSFIGKTSFIDYDADSYIDMLTSLTLDGVTTIYVMDGKVLNIWFKGGCKDSLKDRWRKLLDLSTDWVINPQDDWLRGGDVDNDGFSDLLVTLMEKATGNLRPFILHNVECDGACLPDTRIFSIQWDWLPVEYNISQVAFFDIQHDGRLDVLCNSNAAAGGELHLLINDIAKQSCFVSVKVGSGLCPYEKNSGCSKTYGNIVGPTIAYSSTNPDGSSALGTATQLSQSSNGALQLPYVQFGLGTTPNFVDSLTVGIVRQKDQVEWKQTWKTIVPNSHLVVVPQPPDKPGQWLMHLYVTPSQLVLVTGLVLLGLCALVAIIIALLHIKEKYHDRQVKLQESHRFHFSAM
ncbi:T-cell immunomodulatory protein-like [Watersipora subatra]|uniref:T-cell immunomodulatory protein-like n=1 Tax=Watersipora subatra TaxID=2589382 RepID=UPI00355B4894